MDWVFRSRVNHIISFNRIDLCFDLGFDIKYRSVVYLPGFDVTSHLESNAKSCLVVLIGGHRILTSVELNEDSRIYDARLYLYQPVKLDGIYETVLDRRLVCVNKLMGKLLDIDFNVDKLKLLLPSNTQGD